MNKGKGHKKNCNCKLCKGETSFKKGKDDKRTGGFKKGSKGFKGEKNGMFGKKRNCPWTSERNKKNIGEKNSFFGHKHTEETKQINRLNRQKSILLHGGRPNIGKNEKQALDEVEKLFKIKIIRQYPISGYFVDGYCKEKNIVFEVYEKFHERQRTKDKKREDFIINKLKCKFVRIKDN